MTDDPDRHSNDDDLAVRLRAGLDVIAREAGGAPALTRVTASAATYPSRPTRRTWLVAGAIVAVAVVAIGVVWATTRSDPDQKVASGDPATTADGSRPLLDTRWWLTRVTDSGASVPVPTTGTRDLGLRFLDGGSCAGIDDGCYDGPRVEGSDACNGVSRKMTVTGDTVTLGDDYGIHTQMLCGDELATLMQSFFSAVDLTYSIDGDELVLTSANGEVVLTYRAIDTPFGPTSSLVVDDGELDGQAYRLVWQDGGLDFEVVDIATGGDRGRMGVGEDPGRVNAMRSQVGASPYLVGIVPATAARVVYEPGGGGSQEMDIHDVGDPEFAVIGQLVDAAPEAWDLVAYDAAGNEIHRLRWA